MEALTFVAPPNLDKVHSDYMLQAIEDLLPHLEQHLPMEYPVLSAALAQLIRGVALRMESRNSVPSRLTNQGYPIEFAYVWPSNSFRFTADLTPGATALTRFEESLRWIGKVSNPAQQTLLELLKTWVYSLEGKYGAWVGGRCSEGRMQYKLYVEVPEGAPWREWEERTMGTPCPQIPGLRLVMMGIDPTSGDTEWYYRMDALNLPALRTLQLRYALPDRSQEIGQMLKALCQRHIRFEIPSTNLGYSVSFNAAQQAQAFTLYSIAESILGHDTRLRTNVLNFGQSFRWDMDLYQKATTGLGNIPMQAGDTWHGMLGFVAVPERPLQFTIGWTPTIYPHG